MKQQYAILVDTGFFYKNAKHKSGKTVTPKQILAYADNLKKLKYVNSHDLLVVYFNTGTPLQLEIDGDQPIAKYLKVKSISALKVPNMNRDNLASDYFTVMKEKSLTPEQKKQLQRKFDEKRKRAQNATAYREFAKDIHEKGIEISASLDLAMLALREKIFAVIVVTTNPDYIPAFKFVRGLGIQVILDTLGCAAHPELLRNADIIINGAGMGTIKHNPYSVAI